MGFLSLLLASGVLLLLSERVVRRLRPTPDDSDPVLLLLVFSLLQSALMLAAGASGMLRPLPLGAAGVAGALFLILRPERPDWGRWTPDWNDRVERNAFVLLAVQTLVFALKSLVLSPYWGDAVVYHLPKVAVWLQEGRFVWPVGPDGRQWFPAGFELIELWWTAFPRHDALIEAGGIQMFLLASLSVRVLAKAHGGRADLALLVFSFLPLTVLHVTATGNDLASAAFVLSAFALTAARAPWAILALPMLAGAGIKPTFLFAMGGVLAYRLRAGAPGAPPPRAWILPLLAVALLLGGFWYGRNLAVKGHPLHPFYGGDVAGPSARDPLEHLDVLRRTLEELPARVLDRRPYTALSSATTSWGWFVLPAGLPLLLIALRSDPGLRRLLTAFAAAAFPALALSPLSDSNVRFVLWFPAIFAVAASRLPGRLAWGGAVLAAILSTIATAVPYDSRIPEAWKAPRLLARDEPVACLSTEDAPAYRLYNSDFSRRVTYPRTLEELRASGVRYAQVWPGWPHEGELSRWRRVEGRIYEVR